MLKKITGALIILSMIIILAACAESDGGGSDITNAPDSGHVNTDDNVNEENQEADRPASVLPAEMDFGGREFRVITRIVDRVYLQFIVEEMDGEPINDSLFERNSRIEEKYNIKFTQAEIAEPHSTVSRNVRAGDNSYELMIDSIGNAANLGSQSMLLDLYQVPYINQALELEKPWWDQALARDLSIYNTLYFQSGDLLMFDKLRLTVMYFNKDMFQTLGLAFPYEYVYAGTWTVDKMLEITKDINRDINGDGVMDQNDQWGIMSEHGAARHFFSTAGLRTVTLDSDGVPEITMYTPQTIEVIQKILEFLTDGTTVFHADTIRGADNVWWRASEYFQENRFALRTSVFEPIVRDLRAMETDFGIIPFTKFNETQESYYSLVEASAWTISLPNNVDPEFAGFITEALAYESGDTLMPAFYDLTLLTKTARDNESEGMLDIIFSNRIYDIGVIFGIGELGSVLSSMTSARNTDFVSRYERIEAAAQRALERFIDTYDVD